MSNETTQGPPSRVYQRLVFLVLAAALAFRLAVVSHDVQDLVVRGPLYDDSFYAFNIARNIAAGYGSTFDQVHPTNGYQPLYVGLLVPLYWLSGDNATVPIYLALVLSAIANVVTGFILYRLVRGFASRAAALFGLVLWAFGPAIVRQAVNGLETSIAMMLIAAALEFYITRFRHVPRPGPRQVVTLGLLLGLATLARVDAVLFGMALAIDAVWVRRRTRTWRPLLGAAATALLVLLPWSVSSLFTVGHIVPESGRATRFLSEAYAPRDVPSVAHLSFANGPPPQLLADNVQRSLMLIGTSPVVHVFTRAIERAMMRFSVQRGPTVYAIAVFLLVVVLVLVFAARRRRVPGLRLPSDYNFLFVHALLLLAVYSLVVFGQIFYTRYYYPIFFFTILLGCLAFDLFVGLLARSPRRQRLVAGVVIAAYAVVLPYMSLHRLHNGSYRFVSVVAWIAQNTEPDARIGVFNSGAIGYFSNRQIWNLDGKVNHAALTALRNDALPEYLAREGIDYVIDHGWILDRFLVERPHHLQLTQLADAEALGVPGWRAYRVTLPPDTAAAGAPHASR